MLSDEEIIARYYVGYYNRAPDPAGFAFWTDAYANGISTLEIANFFSDQVETDALYPYFQDPANNSPEQFINSVYNNLFNRDPDQAGFDFWMAELTSGRVSTGQMIEAIIEGATTNPDLAVVQNKVAAALYWEDQANNFNDFAYDAAATTSANDALAGVTDDVATVTASQGRANTYFAQLSEDKGDPGDGLTNDGSTDDKVTLAGPQLGSVQELTLASAVSDPVINLEAFRNDDRFAEIDGSGQTVVVIDTGIDLNHPAFGPDTNGDGVSDRIIFARDFTNERDGTADDVQGHGSNVASIVASSDPNYTGVAPGANIVALQALDATGSGTSFGIERALQWVVQNAEALNIVAVNMSLGDSSNENFVRTDPIYGDELRILADDLGVTTIVAAGNSYQDFQTEGASSLSGDPNTIAIGAVGGSASSGGEVTFFSQRSDDIPTIFAPGSFIEGAAPGGGSSESSGTSQAAPHVAGMVALAQQLAQQELGRSLTPDEFATLLQQSGDTFVDDENPGDRVINTGSTYTRADMFDLGEAILALGDGTTPPPPPPTDDPDPSPTPGDGIPGNTGSTARIDVGGSQTSTIDFGGDEDYFAVSLTTGSYEIAMRGSASGGGALSDPLLTLLTSGGSFVTSNDDGGNGLDSLLTFEVGQDGEYFISAAAFGSATGSYTLEVTRTGDGNIGEVGDTRESAGQLNPNGSVTSQIDFGGDRDVFAIDLSAGQRVTFDLIGDTLGDPVFTLFGPDGRAVAADDDGGEGLNSNLVYDVSEGGTYYAQAAAWSASQTGSYTLSAAVTGGDGNGDDFGSAPSTAGTVAAGESTTGNLEVLGDEDWFRLDVEAGTTYEISLQGDSLRDPILRIYDSAGNFLVSDDDSGAGRDSFFAFTADATQTLYLGAAAYSDFYEGTYVLTAATSGGGTGGDVPGDSSSTATLASGETLIGTLDTPGDTDWYAINVFAGQSYEARLTSGGGAPINDPYLAIYDQLGNLVLFDDDGGGGLNSAIAFDVFASGRFFISAEAFDIDDVGTYELSLTPLGFSGFFSTSTAASTALVDDFYGL